VLSSVQPRQRPFDVLRRAKGLGQPPRAGRDLLRLFIREGGLIRQGFRHRLEAGSPLGSHPDGAVLPDDLPLHAGGAAVHEPDPVGIRI